ncbi:MAG TPA: DUF4159 domain-containing protein [Tepidisphaeraceae bacterium]|nr:DUF4159 domain-containing protein [Tepidisphaeraceae bacterium]
MTAHRFNVGIVTFAVALLSGLAPASNAATPQQVQQAIEKGQKWLIDHRSNGGTWEEVAKPQLNTGHETHFTDVRARQWGGLTALSTYALLASGVDRRSDNLKPAIQFLLSANIQSTYGVGLSSQLALFIPEKESRELVKRNVAMLLAGMNEPPANATHSSGVWTPNIGFYAYWTGFPLGSNQAEFGKGINARTIGTHQPADWYDRSNGQYAVLGMWALAESGGEIRTSYWEIEDAAWKKAQLHDGGWNYTNLLPDQRQASVSMTAAGIATLFITQDYTLENNWNVCRGGIKNEYIERGLRWMDEHIEQALDGNYYTMYGIERIGTASGRKYFGTKDWYKMGADYLVIHQNTDGSWSGSHGVVPDTAFSLLFLARGRAPVIMNKLQYETDKGEKNAADPWDERPRDVANLAKWAGREEESYFNWQVVNLKVTPEELHDSPILYISGSQALNFSKEDEDKLRTYVQEGGLILGNADCGKDVFTKSFEALGRKLFPKYEFRQTAPNDFIFSEQFKDLKVKPKVMELSNNVRKLMVLIPEADASRAWQAHSVQQKGLFGLGTNLFLYAVDKKNLMTKGDTYLVETDAGIDATQMIKLARLDVGDNPDPEPAGWARLAAILHNTFKTDLKVDLVKPEALAGYKLAHLTGTGKLTLGAAARAALKQFVTDGGTLLVDAAGGDVEFADSSESEIAQTLGGKFELLAENNPVYDVPGAKLEKVGWRSFAAERIGDKKRPKLRGLMVGNRLAVILSREDLSAGIVGEPVDGIMGYDPATATRLMTAMLMFAHAGTAPPPAGGPTTPPGEPAVTPSTAPPVTPANAPPVTPANAPPVTPANAPPVPAR